jgi:hypothetical protein
MTTRHAVCVVVTDLAQRAATALGFVVNVNASLTPLAKCAKHRLSLGAMVAAKLATGKGDASTEVSS